MSEVVVDAAGAAMGGASRLLVELDRYLETSSRADVTVLGASRRLEPSWLFRREAQARGSTRRIALNNVSFVTSGGHRSVLLRNALHFPLPGERHLLPSGSSRKVAIEGRVVRMAALRADLLIAPSSSMADRVRRWLPSTTERTVVWPHPVSPRTGPAVREPGLVVCPILFAPYKKLGRPLRLLSEAAGVLRQRGIEVRIEVTAAEQELVAEGLSGAGLVALGRLDVADVEHALARATAVFYPTTVESFGYPLAEARVNGQAVLAVESPHNREVAGAALVPFATDAAEPTDLVTALEHALHAEVKADPVERPGCYFDRLLGAQ